MQLKCSPVNFICILLFLRPSFTLNARSQRYVSDKNTSTFHSCPINLECSPVLQCPNRNEFVLNVQKAILCGWIYNLPMFCCTTNNFQINSNKYIDENKSVFLNSHVKPNSQHRNNRIQMSKIEELKNFEICGTRIKQVSLYIIGGSTVVSNTKWPWFGSLILVKDDNLNPQKSNLHHYCGATILTDEFLVTSAHCFPIDTLSSDNLDNYRIGVGSNNINKMITYKIKNVFIHPNASSKIHYNDIALIKLKHKLQFNQKVRPICLSFLESFHSTKEHETYSNNEGALDDSNESIYSRDESFFENLNFDFSTARPFYGFPNPKYRISRFRTNDRDHHFKRNLGAKFPSNILNTILIKSKRRVSIAGFGDTQFGGLKSDLLKEANLIIVDRKKCNEIYSKLNSSGLNKGINEEFICAGDSKIADRLNANSVNLNIQNKTHSRDKDFRKQTRLPKRSITSLIDYYLNILKNKISNSTNVIFDESQFLNYTLSKANDEVMNDVSISDACQGDSGGPLIVKLNERIYSELWNSISNKDLKSEFQNYHEKMNRLNEAFGKKSYEGRFFLVGIVSLGKGCGDKDYPGVYLNLNFHKNWILNTIFFDTNNPKFKF